MISSFFCRVFLGLALGLSFLRTNAQNELPSAKPLPAISSSWKILKACPSRRGYFVMGQFTNRRLLIGECNPAGQWFWWRGWGNEKDSLYATGLAKSTPTSVWVTGKNSMGAMAWHWKRTKGRWQMRTYDLGEGSIDAVTTLADSGLICVAKDQNRIRLLRLQPSGKPFWEIALALPTKAPTGTISLLITQRKHIALVHSNTLWVFNLAGRIINVQQSENGSLQLQSLTENRKGELIGVGTIKDELFFEGNRDVQVIKWTPDGERAVKTYALGDPEIPEQALALSVRPDGSDLVLSQTDHQIRADVIKADASRRMIYYQLNKREGSIVQALPLAAWQGNFMLFLNRNGRVWLQTTRPLIEPLTDSTTTQTDQLWVSLDVFQSNKDTPLQARDAQPLRYHIRHQPGRTLSCRLNKTVGNGYAFMFTRTNSKSKWQDRGWIHLDRSDSLRCPASKKPYEILLIISSTPWAFPLRCAEPLVYQLLSNVPLDSMVRYTSASELADWQKLPVNQQLKLQTSLDGRTIACDSFRGESWFPILIDVY